MNNIVKKFKVQGRVQGVFYRASTREKALSLSLSGYAKNLPDGSVEVLTSGAAADVDELAAWLWEGPSAAKVNDVVEQSVSETEMHDIQGFTTA